MDGKAIERQAAIEGDRLRAIAAMLADAFHDDPMQRWLFPDESRRRRRLSRFFELDIRHRLNRRSVMLLAGGGGGVAFWQPPGPWGPPLHRAPAIAPAFLSVLRHHPVLAARTLREVARHHPATPHWYLSHLGVAPDRQGEGLGGALVTAGTDLADAEGMGAYLETTNPDNLAFYRAAGFETARTVEVRGAPEVWLMWRPPRPPGTRETDAGTRLRPGVHQAAETLAATTGSGS